MSERILYVDDDQNVLDGFLRQLGRKFKIVCALGGAQGLEVVKTQGPFAVVVADFRMPGEDGIQFLNKVKAIAPDTTRMLLTGNADLGMAINAINQGEIFRFLTKPCDSKVLATSLLAGLDQYRLITAERVLLQQTVTGSIKVLCEILSLVNPEAFGRSSRIVRYVKAMAHHLQIGDVWAITTAAVLSQIGCVILPPSILEKVYKGASLSADEDQLFHEHPSVAADLLAQIPRMEIVAHIIRHQDREWDETDPANIGAIPIECPLESRILKLALDFDALESSGLSKTGAFNRLKQRKGRYDPVVLDAMKCSFADEIKYELKSAVVAELSVAMILAEDLKSGSNVLLAPKGQEVNQSLIVRLQNFKQIGGVREPFMVLLPLSSLPAETPLSLPVGKRKVA